MAPLAAASVAFIAVQQQKGGGIRKNNLNIINYSRITIRRYVDTTTSPHRRKHILYATENPHSADDDIQSSNSYEKDTNPNNEMKNVAKPLSPLAMAAADWLEEEEDELAMNWESIEESAPSKLMIMKNVSLCVIQFQFGM